MVAKKLSSNAVPSKDPATYTSTQIENNKDGLFVAKIITDKAMFGKTITIQSNGGSKRKRRGKNYIVFHFVPQAICLSSESDEG